MNFLSTGAAESHKKTLNGYRSRTMVKPRLHRRQLYEALASKSVLFQLLKSCESAVYDCQLQEEY